MALDLELFKKVVAPEFAERLPAEINMFAAEAELEIAVNKWGAFAPRAIALITAHLMKLFDLSKSGDSDSPDKQIKKLKTGDLEKEFAVTNTGKNSDDTYSLTVYGREYKRLRKKILKGPIFVC